MNLTHFLSTASYVVDELEDDFGYRAILEVDTHDLWFIIKENNIIQYGAYNKLDDSSVFFTPEEIEQIKQWFKLIMEYTRVVIRTDDSGHDYVLPYELSEEFSRLLDLGEVAEDEFIDKFERYMCGGDPFGEYKFYIKTGDNNE